MHNRTFWKALHSLAHPLSLMAILLLLFNDHWLRYAYPSWLTGKLGDFTWLVFAPFITALLLAWIIPQRWKQQSRIVGLLSISFIGVWFATAKTIPFVHELTTQTLYAIVGWEGQLRLDIADLLTLPALLISGYIWGHASDEKVLLKPLAYVAFGLGILGTLATSQSVEQFPDYGILAVCSTDNFLNISTSNAVGISSNFKSYDGGLTWESFNQEDLTCSESSQTLETADVFRWSQGDVIEISHDNGETWHIDNDLVELDQDIRFAYRQQEFPFLGSVKTIYDEPGPHDAEFDINTGNVVFAMGWNGLLIRTSVGQYQWVRVGMYGLSDLTDLEQAYPQILFELSLAIALVFLIITSSTVAIRYYDLIYRESFLSLGWCAYGIIMLTLLWDRLGSLYISTISVTGFLSFISLVFLAIPLSIGAIWDILRNFHSVALQIALAGVGNGALFIFPFILWTQGRIPRYVVAYVFAVFLTFLGLYATRIYLKQILPVLEPEKVKRDAIEKNKLSEDA